MGMMGSMMGMMGSMMGMMGSMMAGGRRLQEDQSPSSGGMMANYMEPMLASPMENWRSMGGGGMDGMAGADGMSGITPGMTGMEHGVAMDDGRRLQLAPRRRLPAKPKFEVSG